ncbi:hypothetical protein QJQ45_013138 [Haematococcus lacustris]|nr:hypothetical protein QJQ45_013138 [Haematococcus lacustris]
MAQRRAAESEAKAQAGAAEAKAEAQADAGAYEAQLHQLQPDLQQREQQAADTQRLQHLQQQMQDLQQDELQRKEQQVPEQQQQLQQQQADMHMREQQLAEQQHQLQQQKADMQQREQQVAQQQQQLQQQQADLQQREQQVAQQHHQMRVGAKPSLACLQRQCAACKDRKVGVKAGCEGVQLQYRQFNKLDNGQGVELATVQTTLGKLVAGLSDLMQKQLWHQYLAKHQRATFRAHCAAVLNTPGLVVVSCDWSEKLTIHQDIACQGAYWKQRTMSVFVACVHYQDMAGNYREESVFVSADKCDQSAEASTTALVQVIECLLQGRRHPDDGWVGKMDMRQLCLCTSHRQRGHIMLRRYLVLDDARQAAICSMPEAVVERMHGDVVGCRAMHRMVFTPDREQPQWAMAGCACSTCMSVPCQPCMKPNTTTPLEPKPMFQDTVKEVRDDEECYALLMWFHPDLMHDEVCFGKLTNTHCARYRMHMGWKRQEGRRTLRRLVLRELRSEQLEFEYEANG